MSKATQHTLCLDQTELNIGTQYVVQLKMNAFSIVKAGYYRMSLYISYNIEYRQHLKHNHVNNYPRKTKTVTTNLGVQQVMKMHHAIIFWLAFHN